MKQNLINLNLLQSKIFKNKQKILVLTSNNKESEHVVKKLQNDFKDIKIVNFPDREILPYDHFSTPDLILKERVNAINNFEDSQILVSSFKNLLEYYPEKKFFLSKQLLKSGDQFNFNKFITMLKSMNFIQVEKVNAVGEFTIRGGIVDLHTINYENPLRFEFGVKYSVDIKNEGTTTERSYVNEINSSIDFSRTDGMTVPFFGDLNNNVSFSINMDWEMTYTLLSTQLVESLDDFNLQSRKTTLSFRPNVSYNFSKYVNGTVFYKYILENDLISGRDKINDFGFTVNIKIQG